MTGNVEWLATSSEILPSKKWAIPFLPCVATATKSAPIRFAKFEIPCSTV